MDDVCFALIPSVIHPASFLLYDARKWLKIQEGGKMEIPFYEITSKGFENNLEKQNVLCTETYEGWMTFPFCLKKSDETSVMCVQKIFKKVISLLFYSFWLNV